MTSLQDRIDTASELLGRRQAQPAPPDPVDEYEPREGDPEMIPVHLAWLRVRADIGSIAKREQYKERDRESGATKVSYTFRGVDTVVRAFGPVTMSHGVSVLPIRVDAQHRDTTSSRGNKMRECTVVVTWLIVGPMGDTLTLQSAGEALDTADKGTAKAQSVALRVLLLSAGLTPTGDPDPDSVHVDRGEAPVRPLTSYVDEITDPATSDGRLRQIHAELKQQRRLTELVTNELGTEEEIGAVFVRVVQARRKDE